ncbi:MAG TPA: hypothetical protein VKQ72_15260 [Aggregatilineales bacterium]|nr:hypothetical protein [Aggregatilineales bacterium]
MSIPDLRILALADAKLLPPDVQEAFDRWRIWRARDAVTSAVRRRLLSALVENLPTMMLYLERLEHADTEKTIFEGIYALAEVVEVNRTQLGLHSGYIVLIMSGQLNPWGLLEFQQDFDNPAPSAVAAADELWRLASQQELHIPTLLARIKDDPTLDALNEYYSKKPLAASNQQSAPKIQARPNLPTASPDGKGADAKLSIGDPALSAQEPGVKADARTETPLAKHTVRNTAKKSSKTVKSRKSGKSPTNAKKN